MNTPAAASAVKPAAGVASSAPSSGSTLGARLAAASRKAQGFASVSDPAVLTGLAELCAAPRATRRTVAVQQEGPAS